MTQTQYTYNNVIYTDFYAVRALFPHVSWGDNVTDADLSMFGITRSEVEIVEPVITYAIYCYVASSSPTTVPSTTTYTPDTNEVLMATAQTDGTQVAKEDGTWVTPPSGYTVYKCVDGKLAIDVDATVSAINDDYKKQYRYLNIESFGADMSLINGVLTTEQHATNVAGIADDFKNLAAQLKTEQEVALNG